MNQQKNAVNVMRFLAATLILAFGCTSQATATDMVAEFQGNFYTSTCSLYIEYDGVNSGGSSKIINLGNAIQTAGFQPGLMGFPIDDRNVWNHVKLTLKSPGNPGSNCTFGTSNTLWGVYMPYQGENSFVVTPDGLYSFLKNKIPPANGGSNVALAIVDKSWSWPFHYTTGYVSPLERISDPVMFHVRFVRSMDGIPTTGAYNSSINLIVMYR